MDGFMRPTEQTSQSAAARLPFWIVRRACSVLFNDNGRPAYRHFSRAKAETEARRLLNKHGAEMCVLKATALLAADGTAASADASVDMATLRFRARDALDVAARAGAALDGLFELLGGPGALILAQPELRELVSLRAEIHVLCGTGGPPG